MISTSEFKKGVFIELDNTPFLIVDFQHVKPGKGNAFVRTRLKNLLTGSVLEKTFRSGEKMEEPDVSDKRMQYLYSDREGHHFMDLEDCEQVRFLDEQVEDKKGYLVENLEVDVLFFRGRPVSIAVPNFVDLEITQTDPGGKGDTSSGGGKPATLSTGLVVNVPFHIKTGDIIKIDTRTNEYIEKLK